MATILSLHKEKALAETVKTFPVLYDKNHSRYRESAVVSNAWTVVATNLGFVGSAEKAKSLFTTLKKKYLRKKRELNKAYKSGASQEVIRQAEKSLQLYDFLEWVDEFVQTREWRTYMSLKDEDHEEECGFDETSSLSPTNICDVHNSSKQELSSSSAAGENLNSVATEIPQIENRNNNMARKRKVKADDECTEDLFCKSLASELKELPYYERCRAKNDISNIVFKHQMDVMRRENPPTQFHTSQANFRPSLVEQLPRCRYQYQARDALNMPSYRSVSPSPPTTPGIMESK